MQQIKKRIFLVLSFLSAFYIAFFFQKIVKGVITAAITKQPLQSVSVYFKGGKGVTSGADGAYTLTSANAKLTVVQYSYVGYKTIIKNIFPGREQEINIQLEPDEKHSDVS